jgi:nucleoside-diphosphate-sugar epimerase/GT2 family glycosyltransferase
MNTLTPSAPPRVSIIIVNYNGGAFLLQTVRAALGSTLAVEVFVVDNASADSSVADLRAVYGQDARLHILQNRQNLGFARANNLAITQAKGQYLVLLNPDCLIRHNTLEQMLEALKAHPEAGMAGCLIVNPDGSEQAGCRRAIPTPWTGFIRVLHLERFLSGARRLSQVDNPLPSQPISVDAISGAFMMVRRDALEQVGAMDERYFLHCEDLDWCKAFQQAGWKVMFVPAVKIIHHKGVCSVHRPLFVLWHKHWGMARFYRKYLAPNYPLALNYLVLLGIGLRYAALLPVETAKWLWPASAPPLPEPEPTPPAAMPPLAAEVGAALHRQRILVTGGTGFIGKRLVDELLALGAKVTVLTRQPEQVARLWPKQPITARRGDLEAPASLAGACDGMTLVFHLASCAHMLDPLANDDARHRQVTEQGTLALLATARASQVKSFVFVSSVKAMGEEDERCLDENTPTHPETPYGLAKLHAEQAVLATGGETGMRATVLRLPMVYGPGNKGNLPRMIEAIRHRRFPPLPDVANRRSMVHVNDTVQAMLLAAVKPVAAGQVYIVTDGRAYSTREIYRLIAKHLHMRAPQWSMPLLPLRMAARFGDGLASLGVNFPLNTAVLGKLLGSAWYRSEKISRELGFKAHYDLQRALPEIILGMDAEAGNKTPPNRSPG